MLAKTTSPQVACLSTPFPFPPPTFAAAAAATAARRRFSDSAEALQTRAEEAIAARQSRGTPTVTATAPGEAEEKADLLPSLLPRRALREEAPAAVDILASLLASWVRSRGTACCCENFGGNVFFGEKRGRERERKGGGEKREPFLFSPFFPLPPPPPHPLKTPQTHPGVPLEVPRPQPQAPRPRPRAARQHLDPRPRDAAPVPQLDEPARVLRVGVPRPPEDATVGDPGGGGGGGGGRGVACSLGDRRRGTLVRLRLGGGEER